MGVVGSRSSSGKCGFWVLTERVQEDIGKQVAKLVSNDVILARRHKLDECLASRFRDDHADILLDDQHLIAFFNGLMRFAEDLLG